ncbi:MAG: translocation/assembly module TamB domain-containing protein [Candidatus Methylomirabilales bacterium]
MSRRRRILLTLLAAVGLLFLAAGAGGWLLANRYGEALARERIQAALAGALRRPVSLERVELNPWLLRAHVYGLRAEGREPGAPLLQLGHGRVRVAASSLWRGQVTLAALLEDLTVRIEPEAAGDPSGPLAVPAIPESVDVGPVTVGIAEVRVVRGRVIYAPPADGRVEVQGLQARVAPVAGRLRVAARAEAVHLGLASRQETFRRVDVQGRLTRDALEVAALEASWEGQPIRVEGRIFDLRTPPKLRFTVRAQMDLARLAARAGLAIPVQGTADVQAEVGGEITAPQVTGTISAPRLSVGPVTTGPALLRGTWADGRLTLSQARVELWSGRLEGSATLVAARLAETQATLRLEAIALQALPPALGIPPGLRGRISGSADLSGDPRRLESLQGRFDVAAEQLLLPGPSQRLGPGTARAAGTFAGRGVDLARAEARWPGVDLEARGGLSASGPRSLRLVLGAALARLAPLWGAPDVAGQATLTAELEGTWQQLRAAGRLAVPALRVAGAAFTDVEARLRYADAVLRVAPAGATLGGSRLSATGTATGPPGWRGFGDGLPEPIRFQAELAAPALRLVDLRAWIPPRFQAAGTLALTAVLEGTPAAWQARGQLRAAALQAPGDLPVPDASAAFALDPTGLQVSRLQVAVTDGRVQGTLAFPAAGLQAEVQGPLDPAATLQASLALRDVAVQPIVQQLTARPGLEVSGRIGGRATASIPLRAPATGRARATLDPVALTIAGDAWRSREPVLLRWEARTLHVDRLRLESRLGSFSAEGAVEPGGRVDLRLDGQVPLGILPALRPEVREAQGLLSLQGSLQGSTAAPRVRGEGRLRDVSLALRDYPDALRDLQAQFVVSQAGLRLEQASGRLGTGRFQASGTAILEGRRLGNYRLRLTGRELPLAPVEGLRSFWDADLELVGSPARALLQGEARLQRGSYTQETSLLGLLLAPRAGKAAGPGFDLRLKVQLLFPSPLAVRTELARLPVGGAVRLEGTLGNPVVFGTLQASEGTILFRKQEFSIVSATARFTDPRRIDPLLDVEAQAEIRRYLVTLRITGPSHDLNVRFASAPPLPQEDLLALVVFGVTREEFGAGAAGIVAGEAAQLMVQEFLGVDPGAGLAGFDVDLQRTGAGAGVLRVERDLTRRARVILSQELGGEGERRLRVEYRLLGPLLVAGEQNFRGSYGADLVLRMRFR